MKYYFTLFVCCLLISTSNFAQSEKEEVDNLPAVLIHFDYSYQMPLGDMSDRFTNNSAIGFGGIYKTRNNWLLGLDGQFFFGGDVKEDFASNITTVEGFVLGEDGLYAELDVRQQGVYGMAKIGRLFSKKGAANPNSGWTVLLGVGYLQHKIQIEDRNRTVPQFQGDYRKGYDRLSSGIAFSQFIGYTHLSLNRRVNFFIGVEAVQAFTKGRRSILFNTQMEGTASRVDLLVGPKIGWTFPIYVESKEGFYTE